jgi:hypothetical protein
VCQIPWPLRSTELKRQVELQNKIEPVLASLQWLILAGTEEMLSFP